MIDPKTAEPVYDAALNCWTYAGRCFYASPTNINPQENAELHYLRDLCTWLGRRKCDPICCIDLSATQHIEAVVKACSTPAERDAALERLALWVDGAQLILDTARGLKR